jgi:RNA polymerase sigma-70 factor (ECF subfamily)
MAAAEVKRLPLLLSKPGRPAGARGVLPIAPRGALSPRSFEDAVIPHLDSAYNLARYLTRDATLEEDMVQDALVRALRAFGQFRGESPRAWLLTIVRNCCRSALTARAGSVVRLVESLDGETDPTEQHADESPDPERTLLRESDARMVRELVEALPEPFREAIVLRDLEEMSYKEIAQVTGVAMGTVMSRISRARGLLAERLTGDRVEPGSTS